ncbi:hypothetical protein SAMN04488559_11618 [Isobaculum melis]|uniref:Uncharacterized protein n=1 Tax=Isobaculum melis TaxID=142588 RepID=A0A1H9TT56_9LACT|nr:hypothetical protein SAMN04488559_11618 [Isobaculum melis]
MKKISIAIVLSILLGTLLYYNHLEEKNRPKIGHLV